MIQATLHLTSAFICHSCCYKLHSTVQRWQSHGCWITGRKIRVTSICLAPWSPCSCYNRNTFFFSLITFKDKMGLGKYHYNFVKHLSEDPWNPLIEENLLYLVDNILCRLSPCFLVVHTILLDCVNILVPKWNPGHPCWILNISWLGLKNGQIFHLSAPNYSGSLASPMWGLKWGQIKAL